MIPSPSNRLPDMAMTSSQSGVFFLSIPRETPAICASASVQSQPGLTTLGNDPENDRIFASHRDEHRSAHRRRHTACAHGSRHSKRGPDGSQKIEAAPPRPFIYFSVLKPIFRRCRSIVSTRDRGISLRPDSPAGGRLASFDRKAEGGGLRLTGRVNRESKPWYVFPLLAAATYVPDSRCILSVPRAHNWARLVAEEGSQVHPTFCLCSGQ